MPERKVPTLADAQRQVWVRSIIGWLLCVLTVVFLLLYGVKDVYLNLPHSWGGRSCAASLIRSYETGASWICYGGRSHPRSRGRPYRQPRNGSFSMSFGALAS